MMGWFFGLAEKVQQAIIIALLVALVVVGAAAAWWRVELGDVRLEAARLAGDLAVEKANVVTLKNSIATQNKAVDALKDETDKRVALAEEARKRANIRANRNEAKAADLLAAKPADPNDLCASALKLYRERGGK